MKMKKTNKSSKLLIKRNLISKFNKSGIDRLNPDAINSIESHIQKYIDKLSRILKYELTINARKTLKKEDVKKAIEKLDSQYKEEFEI
ncbi:MAG: hypothetical protein WC584_03530 [Candidatus Pacearchaeota archaeon]